MNATTHYLIRVAVPRMELGEKAATGLPLVIHELAKNSLKYGALSSDTGLLGISAKLAEDDIEIVWSEQGGNGAKAPKSQSQSSWVSGWRAV